jgi:chromosome segregation ATPase
VRTLSAEAESVRPAARALEPRVAGLAAINIISAEHCSLTATREAAWRALTVEADLAVRDAKAVRAARAAEVGALLDTSERERQAAADALAAAQTDLELVDLRRATVAADNIQLLDEIGQAESSAEAARALAAQLRQHFDVLIGQLTTAQSELDAARRRVDERQAQIAALYATRTMRWTRLARQIYHWIRQHQAPPPS